MSNIQVKIQVHSEKMNRAMQDFVVAAIEAASIINRALKPILEELTVWAKVTYVALQREQLYRRIPKWVPDQWAAWIATRCPEQLLPKLRLENNETDQDSTLPP